MGLFMLPIILILVVVLMVFSVLGSFGSSLSTVASGGNLTYDENVFQDYADAQYQKEFGMSTAYEDNLLLVFLAEDEEYWDYAYIAWVGDHVDTRISDMFGNEQTTFGMLINDSINASSYKYSLDSNLARVVENMSTRIGNQNLPSFKSTCRDQNHAQVASHMTNYTSIPLTEQTVNDALVAFTEETGISVVLVVEDIDDVFDRTIPPEDIFTLILAAGILVVAIVLIVRTAKKNKKNGDDNDPGKYGNDRYNRNENRGNYNRYGGSYH